MSIRIVFLAALRLSQYQNTPKASCGEKVVQKAVFGESVCFSAPLSRVVGCLGEGRLGDA